MVCFEIQASDCEVDPTACGFKVFTAINWFGVQGTGSARCLSPCSPFMISANDRDLIQDIARKYNVTRVILFGSSLSDSVDSHDIDIAVEGLADREYFSFYGELLQQLSKPVDVVDLSKKSKFVDMIEKEGILLNA
ncbi:MAG: nucleotidyltransferase domain-containing protein [Pelovirga sp.]